jgi:hypothetical protein
MMALTTECYVAFNWFFLKIFSSWASQLLNGLVNYPLAKFLGFSINFFVVSLIFWLGEFPLEALF